MKNLAESVARAFVAAINRGDLDGLAGLMTPGCRFVDSLGSVVEGRDAVRAGWVGYFRMVPDYRIEVEESYWGEEPGIGDSELGGPDSIPPALFSGFVQDDGSSVVVMLGMARGTYNHPSDEDLSTGTPTFAPDGELKAENRWETPVALRALVVDGKVAEWRVYADNEPIRRLMRGASKTG